MTKDDTLNYQKSIIKVYLFVDLILRMRMHNIFEIFAVEIKCAPERSRESGKERANNSQEMDLSR